MLRKWWILPAGRVLCTFTMSLMGFTRPYVAAQDVLEAVLEKMDAAAMCQIKAVSVAWSFRRHTFLATQRCV